MNGILLVISGIVVSLLGVTVGDLVSEEIRGRLDRFPYLLVRVAVRRLPSEMQSSRELEWAGELDGILRDRHRFPIGRLVAGCYFGFGLIASAPRVADEGQGVTRPRQVLTFLLVFAAGTFGSTVIHGDPQEEFLYQLGVTGFAITFLGWASWIWRGKSEVATCGIWFGIALSCWAFMLQAQQMTNPLAMMFVASSTLAVGGAVLSFSRNRWVYSASLMLRTVLPLYVVAIVIRALSSSASSGLTLSLLVVAICIGAAALKYATLTASKVRDLLSEGRLIERQY